MVEYRYGRRDVMEREVSLRPVEPEQVNSPAFGLVLAARYALQFYEGDHFVDGDSYNVCRIWVAHDPERQVFAVGEEGNGKLHGWYEDEADLKFAFWHWCFNVRGLEPAEAPL